MEITGGGPPAYTYLGCYKDWGGPYTNIDTRGRTFPVWIGYDMSTRRWRRVSVDECAAAARDRGYQVFALQWYGACFLGSLADVAVMHGRPGGICQDVPCAPSQQSCPGWTNKVFLLGGMPPCPMHDISWTGTAGASQGFMDLTIEV
jgi:hypothetical protein